MSATKPPRPISPDLAALILESLAAGCALDKAARAVSRTIAEVRAHAAADATFREAMAAAIAAGSAGARTGEETTNASNAQETPAEPERVEHSTTWADVARVSAEMEREEVAAREPSPRRKRKAGDDEDAGGAPLDVERIVVEASRFAAGPFGFYLWLESKLAAKGFHQTSEWWRFALGELYASGKTWGIFEVGRGGGKSTTLTRVASCEGLFGARQIPPGQRWIWPFISVSTADARRRIVEINAILRAIGIEAPASYPNGQPTIELVDLRGQPIAFVAIAGTIAGVSGPSAIGATIDEEAKLRDKAENVNPATEVLASIVQMFRARPGIRAIRCSSAWTNEGSHASAIREGDTIANHVARVGERFVDVARQGFLDVASWEDAHGDRGAADRVRAHAATVRADSPHIPTWLANPTISAVASREQVEALPESALDGVPKVAFWLRENGSVPSEGAAVRGLRDPHAAAIALRAANAQLAPPAFARSAECDRV